LRTAEVLLNVAEASYRSGDGGTALTLLNQLRKKDILHLLLEQKLDKLF
jgi:hypothetical protein